MEFTSSHGRELARHMGFIGSKIAFDKLDQHLAAAIQEFSLPSQKVASMRGLQRLSNLTHSVVADADAAADKAADRLLLAQKRISDATGRFEEFITAVENTAAEAEAALGQITNSPPTPPAA